jgi:hypothetical protein
LEALIQQRRRRACHVYNKGGEESVPAEMNPFKRMHSAEEMRGEEMPTHLCSGVV